MSRSEAFNEKRVKCDLDFALNLRMDVSDAIGRNGVLRLVHDAFAGIEDTGMTNDEILQQIALSPLADCIASGMSNATLQFLCRDHELRDNEYVFREAEVIMI